MASFRKEVGLDFKNVLLVPQYSTIKSRSHVMLNTIISKNERDNTTIGLRIPIISANMDTITGESMVIAMYREGATGFLHRYQSYESISSIIQRLKLGNIHPIIPSIGVGQNAFEEVLAYNKLGADAICIDVAHADSEHTHLLIERLVKTNPALHIIAGNIGTADAAVRLAQAGATAVKVGIGNGSVCLTRNKTGCGINQLTAITEVSKALSSRIPVIADGGIKDSNDIVKALAAGASAIMTGSLFSGCDETVRPDEYRGMASFSARQEFNSDTTYIEGTTITPSQYSISTSKVIKQLLPGIKSGFSYCGAHNIKELWENAEFIIQG